MTATPGAMAGAWRSMDSTAAAATRASGSDIWDESCRHRCGDGKLPVPRRADPMPAPGGSAPSHGRGETELDIREY
jgi:hypothetical protein